MTRGMRVGPKFKGFPDSKDPKGANGLSAKGLKMSLPLWLGGLIGVADCGYSMLRCCRSAI